MLWSRYAYGATGVFGAFYYKISSMTTIVPMFAHFTPMVSLVWCHWNQHTQCFGIDMANAHDFIGVSKALHPIVPSITKPDAS